LVLRNSAAPSMRVLSWTLCFHLSKYRLQLRMVLLLLQHSTRVSKLGCHITGGGSRLIIHKVLRPMKRAVRGETPMTVLETSEILKYPSFSLEGLTHSLDPRLSTKP
jgi:hypothetical protein